MLVKSIFATFLAASSVVAVPIAARQGLDNRQQFGDVLAGLTTVNKSFQKNPASVAADAKDASANNNSIIDEVAKLGTGDNSLENSLANVAGNGSPTDFANGILGNSTNSVENSLANVAGNASPDQSELAKGLLANSTVENSLANVAGNASPDQSELAKGFMGNNTSLGNVAGNGNPEISELGKGVLSNSTNEGNGITGNNAQIFDHLTGNNSALDGSNLGNNSEFGNIASGTSLQNITGNSGDILNPTNNEVGNVNILKGENNCNGNTSQSGFINLNVSPCVAG